ncbi:MAG TPA: pyridoxamine 5'-phosphate oxidase family protein [Xanthobacteraceae bacterium]|nr:pyridoxamine 5'-phosphate oxidase family protein [Xanthobacteraceae bacterium]
MAVSRLFHHGNRALQDEFQSRAIADRLEQVTTRSAFSESDKEFIESAIYFFLATADGEGHPDCSFKGGATGFVRVTGPSELAFPDFDGNGMFKSLGNIADNPHVGLLFVDFEKPRRLRVNGTAMLCRNDRLLACTVGAQLIVRVEAHAIFPNCPRYIPAMKFSEESAYAPKAGVEFPEPAWKTFPEFKDAIHPRHPTYKG